jgi:hypothetical protein
MGSIRGFERALIVIGLQVGEGRGSVNMIIERQLATPPGH